MKNKNNLHNVFIKIINSILLNILAIHILELDVQTSCQTPVDPTWAADANLNAGILYSNIG